MFVENLAHGRNTDLTYLDISKAFDLVDHSLLLRKMKNKGFCGKLLMWIRNFLLDRKQQVRVGQTLSRKAPLHLGIPQGSILGPLLFLIFITDLDDDLNDAAVSILKYVDDSEILAGVTSLDDVKRTQSSLDSIYTWVDRNNMRWNHDKFQLLRIGKNISIKEDSYYFLPGRNNIIEEKEYVKDLGVLVDNQLTYREHRQKAIGKIAKMTGWIKRIFFNHSVPFLKTLWNSLLQPHLDYCLVLTAPNLKCEIMTTEKPLKRFTMMTSDGKKLHYWERLQLFKLLSNQRRMERYKLLYIWKSIHGYVPSLGLKWKQRDPTKLVYPKTFGSVGRTRTLQKSSLNWEGVHLFNCLPLKIRTYKGTKESFKNVLDQFLSQTPDQPETSVDKAEGRTLLGESSNSVPDWLRILDLHTDNDLDDGICDDDVDDYVLLVDGGEASFMNVCSSSVGPGLSPVHGRM